MADLDYKKLGLKGGIEIHQQLDTNKLFCSCPSILRDDKPDIVVSRRLKAAAGESGDIDVAAMHEQQRDIEFIYEAYSDTTCLVELDEEPPHEINKEALKIALEVALLLNSKPIKNIQVMRKTVVDGSNTSGFQRTAFIANDGFIITKEGKISIMGVFLEEEAAKIVEKGADFARYRLDRLGIPLVEIATGPDIKSPEEFKEAAAFIGMVLRSTNKVKRGLGTIRQDLNISIKDGKRIEIKGAQDLKLIPKLVEYEVLRQKALIDIKNMLPSKEIHLNIVDLTAIFENTQSSIIKKGLDKKSVVLGVKLEGYSGLLGKETQPGRRIGSEISDYAKVKAGVGGMFHSDEQLIKYGMSQPEIDSIKKVLACKEKDAFILICDDRNKVEKALKAAVDRTNLLKKGVLKEVRKANDDATTSFMRPMPGGARMYPETDVPIIKLTEQDIKAIKLPELLAEKAERAQEKFELGKDLADLLSKSGKHDIFEYYVTKFVNLKPAFIAETILTTDKILKRKYDLEVKIADNIFEAVLTELNHGRLTREILPDVFYDYAKTRKLSLDKFMALSDEELKKEVIAIKKESEGVEFNALMNKAMTKLKGKADAKKIIDMLKNLK